MASKYERITDLYLQMVGESAKPDDTSRGTMHEKRISSRFCIYRLLQWHE